MLTWEWHSFDLASGRYNGQVLMESWQHEDRLNDAGSWSAKVAPPENADHARYLQAATEPGKALIVATTTDDEGVTRAEYTGWVPPKGRKRNSELAGASLLSYLDRRILQFGGPSLTYGAWEQTAITADLILRQSIQTDTVTGVSATGVLRDQTWTKGDGKIVGEALRQIPARIGGFDWSLGYEYTAGVFTRRYRTFYPRRGPNTLPIFKYPGNMKTFPQVEGGDIATEAYGIGVQTNAELNQRLTSVSINQALIDAGYPIIDIRLDRNDVTTQTALDQLTQGARFDAGRAVDDELSFVVDPNDTGWKWGTWDLGTDCSVEADPGMDVWYPDGVNALRRVVAHRWNVAGPASVLTVVTGRKWEVPA